MAGEIVNNPDVQDHLSKLGQDAAVLLALRERLFVRNVEYYGAEDFDNLITQEALDEFLTEHPNSPLRFLRIESIPHVESLMAALLTSIDNQYLALINVKRIAE